MSAGRMAALRRAAAACGLCALALAAAPASASPGVSVRLSGVTPGQSVAGQLELEAVAESASGIERLELTISGEVVASLQPQGYRREARLPHTWDTTRTPDGGGYSANGPVEVKAVVVPRLGNPESSAVTVNLDNPPGAPARPSARVRQGAVVLRWAPNPEPDVGAYVVERSDGSGFREIATTASTSLRDEPGAGTWFYRVSARRPGSSGTLTSPPSPPAHVTVLAAAPGGGPAGGRGSPGRAAATGGTPVGKSGLPSLGLPSAPDLPRLPDEPEVPWGTYRSRLPYGRIPGAVPDKVPVRSDDAPVPPDTLRSVAAGALALALAVALRRLARRVA